MSLTTRTLASLLNGISYQPAILRSPDQTEDEVNTWGSLANGLGRRAPTKHIAEIDVAGIEDAFVHQINRDVNERYLVIIGTVLGVGTIRVFDLTTGVEKTVATPFGTDYLIGPAGAFKATTVADYTFIVNSSITPTLAGVGADEVAPPAGLYTPGGWKAYGEGIGA